MQENEGNVRVMTRTEKKFFNGVTIDADSTEGGSYKEDFQSQRRYKAGKTYVVDNSNIFTRLIASFVRALINGNRLARIAGVLIGVAFFGLMFFVALPILFILLAIGIVIFALLNNFR